MYSFDGFQRSSMTTSTPVRPSRGIADLTNRIEEQHEVIEELKFRQDELEERLHSQEKENDSLRLQLQSFGDKEASTRKKNQRIPGELSVS